MNVFWLILLNRLAYKLQNFNALPEENPLFSNKIYSP